MHCSHFFAAALLFGICMCGYSDPSLEYLTPISESEYLYQQMDPADLVEASIVKAEMVENVGKYQVGDIVEIVVE